MAKTQAPNIQKDHVPNGQLVIPVDKNRFGEFISSLLGEPRSTEKSYDEPFKIDKDFIRALSEVISQRVNTQQIASLASFKSKVFYEDGKVQTETSQDSFFDLNDFHTSRPIKIALSWTYLVQFPNVDFPQKQMISLSYDVDKNIANNSSQRRDRQGILSRIALYLGDIDLRPEIKVRIDYTEFTWGTDLLRHIDDQLFRCLRPVSQFKRGLQILSGRTLPIVAATLIMFSVTSMMFFQISRLEEIPIDEFLKNPMLSGSFEQQATVKLDFLVGKAKAVRMLSSIGIISGFLFGIISVVFLFLFSKEQLRSHILLNDAATNHFEKSENYLRKSKIAKALTFVAAIIVGIIGNFGTELVKQYFGIM
jgi:hypothetical protein